LLDKKAVHINNAIDLSKFINFPINLSSRRIELNIPEDTFIVGSIGRLTEQKGYCYLLSAAQIILNKISNVHFLLVGDGEDLSKLELLSRELGISSNITFLGPRSDIVELLQIMDIFISSSLWEGLPSVVLESMAAGTPVIATDIPGSNELIHDQVNGLLVQPGNPEILADAIIYLLNNDQKRKSFSYLSLEKVRMFSIETVTEQYEELYKTYLTS
jgi:glycosyltransferase involved in cell wall biosynthesis